MSNACETCGYRSSDIKAGGGMSEKGTHITLDVSEQSDLRRDVIKSDTASISIPEADLEVTTGIVQGLTPHLAIPQHLCLLEAFHMHALANVYCCYSACFAYRRLYLMVLYSAVRCD